MSLIVEHHTVTGMISNPGDGLLKLKYSPVNNSRGKPDIAVDALNGQGLLLGVDFAITGTNGDTMTYNLASSSIKNIRQRDIDKYGVGSTGLELRVVYSRSI